MDRLVKKKRKKMKNRKKILKKGVDKQKKPLYNAPR